MKRILDFVFATVLLLALLPLLLTVAVLQLCFMGRPVFFRQARAGLDEKPFELIKFRSMQPGGFADADRLTKWGSFLRSTSLDELPELWNVLRGEMSLVGPRPLPVHYLPRYSPEQGKRHTVRPGITGWAQVNGRNALTWEAQFEADLWYVRNHSLKLDLKILLLTVIRVIQREGICEEGSATRSEFMGSAPKNEPTLSSKSTSDVPNPK